MPASGIDGRENTNFLHNVIAPRFGLQVEWDRQRYFDVMGRECWLAILFVNGIMVSQGHGFRIGHAKDSAARQYLVANGFAVPAPL